MRQQWQRILSILLGVAVLFSVSLAEEEISLQILPSGSHQLKALKENLFLTCTLQGGNIDSINDLQWIGPDGKTIPKTHRKYSERVSVDKNMLFIKNIQEEDAGTYRCLAKYALSKELQVEVTLDTFMDITWEDAPTEQHVIVNRNEKIKCVVKAHPSPTVDWSKDGEPFKSSDRCITEIDGILCSPIQPEDEGVYICRARVSETGNIAERVIKVEVDRPPLIDVLQSEHNIIEDGRLVMTCSATGKPIPAVIWVNKEGHDLSKRPGYLVDERTGELTIEKVSTEDRGLFKCIARSSAGEDTKETRVIVVSKPKIKEFNSITAEKNQKAQLICRVHAEPIGRIIIRKKDGSRSFDDSRQYDDRIIIEVLPENDDQLFTVTIKETRDDDDGIYICEASNVGGIVMAEAHLTVEHPPTFDQISPLTVKSWEHNTVNLTCVARSIPNATIEWISLARDISIDPNIVKINGGPISTLQVSTRDNTYYMEYRCRATNKLGVNELVYRIEQAFVPKEVKQANFNTVTATTASFLIVGPDDDGGMPLTNYVVEYTEGDSGETKQRSWPAVGSQNIYILDKLEPEKKYIFKFAAANAVGTGLFTQTKVRVTPKRSFPEEPQIITSTTTRPVLSPYSDRVTIQWKIPEDNGASIEYFQIHYFPINEGSSLDKDKNIQPIKEKPTSTQTELTNLQPSTVYKVEVRAHNSYGFSRPGQITIRTAQDPGSGTVMSLIPTPKMTGTESDQQQLQPAGVPLEVVVGIVIVVVILLLIVVDISCYFMNSCGLLMCLCVHVCGKEQSIEKGKDGIMETGKNSESIKISDNNKTVGKLRRDRVTEAAPMIKGDKEKEALKDPLDNDIRNKSPIGSRSSIAKDSPV